VGYCEGQLPYLDLKRKGDNSMVVKSERQTTTENLVRQDLFPMAKAILPELQFPVDTYQINGKIVVETRSHKNSAGDSG